MRFVWGAMVLGLTLGCSTTGAIKQRAANDLSCQAEIYVRNNGAGSYTATGCGKTQNYFCERSAANGRVSCVKEGAGTAPAGVKELAMKCQAEGGVWINDRCDKS